jgi:hypothetical protein
MTTKGNSLTQHRSSTSMKKNASSEKEDSEPCIEEKIRRLDNWWLSNTLI